MVHAETRRQKGRRGGGRDSGEVDLSFVGSVKPDVLTVKRACGSAPPLRASFLPPRLCVNHSDLSPKPKVRDQTEYFRCPASTVIRFTPDSAVLRWRTVAMKRHSLVALLGVSSTAM